MENNNFKTLVFSGGGIRGISHLGVVEVLEQNNIIQDIETFVGCSVGSIVAFFVSLGFKAKTLLEIVHGTDLEQYVTVDLLKFADRFGMDSGEKLLSFFFNIISDKFGADFAKDLTFQNHFEKTGKKLVITTCCLNNHKLVYLSKDTFPDLHIIHAIRMSISIPFFYTAVKWNGKHFVDGGVIESFPVSQFQNNDHSVLGIHLRSEMSEISEIKTIEQYLVNLLYCYVEKKSYNVHTIVVKSKMNPLDFSLDASSKSNLVQLGKDSAISFFSQFSPLDSESADSPVDSSCSAETDVSSSVSLSVSQPSLSEPSEPSVSSDSSLDTAM